jgi:hypothetical protein
LVLLLAAIVAVLLARGPRDERLERRRRQRRRAVVSGTCLVADGRDREYCIVIVVSPGRCPGSTSKTA